MQEKYCGCLLAKVLKFYSKTKQKIFLLLGLSSLNFVFFVNNLLKRRCKMRANVNALNEIKERIANIKGDSINLSVNRGRKKIDKLKGFVENIYPSVFTFMTDEKARETFSYFDVLCGLVKFEENVVRENN